MRWLIAAGGTGGHLFPALSVAQGLREADGEAEILFVGTDRGLEARVVPARGFPLKTVRASGLMGLGWRARFKTLAGLPWTACQCLRLLAAFRPHLVLGMGGFAAGPMVLLAAMLGFPTAIAEQNAVAGRTNRLLGRWVDRVLVAFAQGADMFPSHKVLLTGNPVRPELVVAAGQAGAQPWSGRGGEAFHLLVFGGSQGARGINRVMAEALPALRGLPVPVEVLHQAAPADLPALEEAYGAAGIAHRLVPFIEDMGRAYAWAHLVLCRAGAVSLAEIALFRKPSVLIPFPHAVDDHQGRNAAVFRAAGASEVLGEAGLNGEALARLLGALAADPARLARMGEAAGGLARPGAGAAVVAECLRLARGEVRSG